MPLEQTLQQLHIELESSLKALFPSVPDSPYFPLFSSARYSLFAPSKRLRPLLLLAVIHGYEIPIAHALVPACAIELIHTYSLIHDDLPCMDNDDWRRGCPALHKAFPEWQALLTGDYLLTYAFELLAKPSTTLDATQALALVECFAMRAGLFGMIGGQMLDLNVEKSGMNTQTLEDIHRGKTAALIQAAFEGGAIIAKLSTSEKQALILAGEAIGIAFQLRDDLLDCHTEKQEQSNAAILFGSKKTQERIDLLLAHGYQHLASLERPLPLLDIILKKIFTPTDKIR